MKHFKNRILMALVAGSGLIFTACQDGETVFDEIIDNETRGAVLRTVSVLSNEIPIESDGSLSEGASFGVILEEQDQEGGDLLDFVEVYVGFRDNTGDENDTAEALIETIPSTEFTIGAFGLPRVTYSITAEDMLAFMGISSTVIEGGDQFAIRFELVLTDGRRYSFADNSGTLTGSFFSSPFLYTPLVVCAPSTPTAGDWTFTVVDSYGDGWNGGSLSVVIDGGDAIEVTNEDQGFPANTEDSQVYTVNVPVGSETISIIYNSGSFDEEVTFTVVSANGNTVIDAGPEPTAGIELLDYCPDNL